MFGSFLKDLLTQTDVLVMFLVIYVAALVLHLMICMGRTWLRWGLPGLSLLLVITACVMWEGGGLGDRIGAGLLIGAAAPCLSGQLTALGAEKLLQASRRTKTVCVCGAALALIVAVWLWPKSMTAFTRLEYSGDALYYDSDGQSLCRIRDWGRIKESIQWAKCIPWISMGAEAERRILFQVDPDHVLLLERGGDSCLFWYSGALEEFSGRGACRRIVCYPALYDNVSLWLEAELE